MSKRRKRGAGGRFVSTKKRAKRRSSRRRRKNPSTAITANPRRRRRRSSSRRRVSRKRRRSVYAMPKANPRRRRRRAGGIRRRRRNPGGLSGGQIVVASIAGAASFAGATILVPRIMPQQLASSPILWGLGMFGLGCGVMFLLRKYPVIALSAGVPITGAGLFLAGTGALAKTAPQAQQQGGSNLGAVVLENLDQMQRRGQIGAVFPSHQLGMGAVFPSNQLGMGAVYPAMGAIEAMIGDAGFSNFRAPSVAAGMGAY